MSFGDRLKEARNNAGMTRSELAKKLGITQSAISNYENGISSPKEDIMLKMFDILCVEPNFLFKDSFKNSNSYQNIENKKEEHIIHNYRTLNDEGQDKLIDYSDDLVNTGRYIKNDSETNNRQA